MRLTYKNIDRVLRYESGGITYAWGVVMKSHNVSDNRTFVNRENGVSVVRDYPVEDLPVTVQQFVAANKHFERLSVALDEDTPQPFRKYTIMRKGDFNDEH